MMGDNVNLAARMESGAKLLGVYTMVTESTKIACEKHGGDRFVFRYLGRIVVKGRSQPVPIYEIVGFKEDVAPQTFECLGVYAQGVERYLAQDWDGAASFRQSAELEPNQPHETPGIEEQPVAHPHRTLPLHAGAPARPELGRHLRDEGEVRVRRRKRARLTSGSCP